MRAKLREMRKEAGYTQTSFASACGISRSYYSQIESGAKNPSFRAAVRIKRKLGYDKDDIFFTSNCPI